MNPQKLKSWRVILPQKNARDLDEVPAEAKEAIEFIFADDMSQVIAAALEPASSPLLADEVPLSGSRDGQATLSVAAA